MWSSVCGKLVCGRNAMRMVWWLAIWMGLMAADAGGLAAEEAAQTENRPGTILGWPTEFDGRYPVGTPPGDGWHYVSGDGKVFSSSCIGEPVSPQCLVDTMMACGAWSDHVTIWPGADRPEGEPDRSEYYNHPICDALEHYPGTAGYGLNTFIDSYMPRETLIWYYRTNHVIADEDFLNEDGSPWSYYVSPESRSPRAAVGDTVVIIVIFTCTNNPAKTLGRYDKSYETVDPRVFPDGAFWYCRDFTNPMEVAFLRQQDAGPYWYVGQFFNPGHQGSRSKPWPHLRAWYDQFRAQALPGIGSND